MATACVLVDARAQDRETACDVAGAEERLDKRELARARMYEAGVRVHGDRGESRDAAPALDAAASAREADGRVVQVLLRPALHVDDR